MIVSIRNGARVALKRIIKFFLFFSTIINIKNKKIIVKIIPTGFITAIKPIKKPNKNKFLWLFKRRKTDKEKLINEKKIASVKIVLAKDK